MTENEISIEIAVRGITLIRTTCPINPRASLLTAFDVTVNGSDIPLLDFGDGFEAIPADTKFVYKFPTPIVLPRGEAS